MCARLRLKRAQAGRAGAADATLLYQRMLQVLENRGVQKPPWLTPAEFARTLKDSELALLVADLTEQYNEVRFGRKPAAAARIAQILQRIEGHAAR
jgi:hypothetical protein